MTLHLKTLTKWTLENPQLCLLGALLQKGLVGDIVVTTKWPHINHLYQGRPLPFCKGNSNGVVYGFEFATFLPAAPLVLGMRQAPPISQTAWLWFDRCPTFTISARLSKEAQPADPTSNNIHQGCCAEISSAKHHWQDLTRLWRAAPGLKMDCTIWWVWHTRLAWNSKLQLLNILEIGQNWGTSVPSKSSCCSTHPLSLLLKHHPIPKW